MQKHKEINAGLVDELSIFLNLIDAYGKLPTSGRLLASALIV